MEASSAAEENILTRLELSDSKASVILRGLGGLVPRSLSQEERKAYEA